jgi:hypothetical protein
MKTYVVATGLLFALLTLVHLWRMAEEPHLASDPWFVLATAVSAVLSIVAWWLSRRQSQS